jgi:hypothetical protein
MKQLINSLEYWLLRPYTSLNDRDIPYVKQFMKSLQTLQTSTPHSEEYDRTLSEIEEAYQENRTRYQYVDKRQIEKAIMAMKGSVISRIISKNIIPVTTKVVGTVKPVVTKTMNETVIPAANKTLCFLHKTFAKKKAEVVEVSPTTEE